MNNMIQIEIKSEKNNSSHTTIIVKSNLKERGKFVCPCLQQRLNWKFSMISHFNCKLNCVNCDIWHLLFLYIHSNLLCSQTRL